MEYRIAGNCGEKCKFTPDERNMLIRYCLTVATRGKCATTALLRPFKQKYLKEAFDEQNKKYTERIAQYDRSMREYDPKTTKLPQWALDYFGGSPTQETYAGYCKQRIKLEKQALRSLKCNYIVYVDYGFVGKKLVAFHNSLNPRATFGYGNVLHEECDFVLDEEKRAAFLNSSLAQPQRYAHDWAHWGNVEFGGARLHYEDLTLFRGEECIIETITHEQMMTVRLSETDIAALALYNDCKKLVNKLKQAAR